MLEIINIHITTELAFDNIYPQLFTVSVLFGKAASWWRNKFLRFKNSTTEDLIKNITLSEERYRQLFNSGNDAIYLHDLQGNFLEVNDVACRMLGYSKKEFQKMTIAEIDDPDQAKASSGKWRQLFEKGSLVCEMVHCKKDGTKVPVELSIKLIDLNGETMVLTHARDITERKIAQEEIRQRNLELVELYKREQEKTAIVQACHNIGHTLSASVVLDEIMTDFQQELLKLVNFDWMWLILIEENEANGKIEVFNVVEGLKVIGTHKLDHDAWASILAGKRVTPQFQHELMLHYISAELERVNSLTCPLISSNKLIGFIVAANEKEQFSEKDFEIIENLTNHLALAIDNSRLQAEIEKMAIKSERSRIAREFHDSVAQNISAIRAKVEFAHKLLQLEKHQDVEVILKELEAIAGDVYSEVRESIFGLKSTIDLQQGLIKILTEQVQRFQREWGIPVELDIQPSVPAKLADNIEIQLLRVIMEALTNVRKHAGANKITITLLVVEDELIITVIDDGQGFEQAASCDFSESYGLKTMQERMQMINGSIDIVSEKGHGTKVQLIIPYENRSEAM